MKALPKFIPIKAVAAMGGISPSTARRYSDRPDFPAPRYFGPTRKVWIHDEVLNWFMSRPQRRPG